MSTVLVWPIFSVFLGSFVCDSIEWVSFSFFPSSVHTMKSLV